MEVVMRFQIPDTMFGGDDAKAADELFETVRPLIRKDVEIETYMVRPML